MEVGDRRSNRLHSTNVPGHGDLEYRYVHDDAGNMMEMTGLSSMTWDWRNAMVRWSNSTGANAIACTYDGAGQRVTKRKQVSATRRTERIYLGGLEIYRELQGDEVVLERRSLHVMDDAQRVLIAEEDEGSEGLGPLVRYQLGNHLGSCAVEVGGKTFGDAKVLSHEEFHPYGTTAYSAGSSELEGRPKRYRFTGMERDEESGLQAHGVRYYAVWLGRWISADIASLDKFQYSFGAPSNFNDTNGAFPHPATKLSSTGKFFLGVAEGLADAAAGIAHTSIPAKLQKVSTAGWRFHSAHPPSLENIGNSDYRGALLSGVLQSAYSVLPDGGLPQTVIAGYQSKDQGGKRRGLDGAIERVQALNPAEPVLRSGFELKSAVGAKQWQAAGKSSVDLVLATLALASFAFGLKYKPKARLPRDGTWTGKPGESVFVPNRSSKLPAPADPRVVDLAPGEGIPFRNGRPDFSRFAWAEFDVHGLNGSPADFNRIGLALAEKYGLVGAGGLPTAAAGLEYMNQLGLVPHHAGGARVQLVPAGLHGSAYGRIGVPHAGGATDLRLDESRRTPGPEWDFFLNDG